MELVRTPIPCAADFFMPNLEKISVQFHNDREPEDGLTQAAEIKNLIGDRHYNERITPA